MSSRRKACLRILDEVKKSIEEEFGNRIAAISCGDISNQWVSSHSVMEVRVAVRRINPDIINSIYDVAYKIMSKNNFNNLISLRVVGYCEENTHRAHRIIKGKLLSDIGMHKEAAIWKAV
ncbi:hypothetical protein [Desulfitibacter alkalitolerans]|uniref:hypothetical protein n=1 Tax=Desulfitibacter alkalitolerans TaxID=264641 RepID=UPI000483944D|nr:hypothetical protein [Desulfitibacter alkalitolerans]